MGRRASRRSREGHRCERCQMHTHLCVCDDIPILELQTRIALVMHKRERTKTTATGPLALMALPNSELFVHGVEESPLDLTHLHREGRRVLLLFPSENARELTPPEDERPVTLIVPDGSWRQASRAARRIPGLAEAEHVVLPAGPESTWRLRREPKEGGLATLEAIARALGILESVEVAQQLQALLDLVVERSLWTRQPSPERLPR